MAAMAYFTISITMDTKGMRISTTTTSLRSSNHRSSPSGRDGFTRHCHRGL